MDLEISRIINKIKQSGNSTKQERRYLRNFLLSLNLKDSKWLVTQGDVEILQIDGVSMAGIYKRSNKVQSRAYGNFKQVLEEDNFLTTFVQKVLGQYQETKKQDQQYPSTILESYVKTSRQSGDSLEYVLIESAAQKLQSIRPVEVVKDEKYYSVKNSFDSLDSETKLQLTLISKQMVEELIKSEPQLIRHAPNEPIKIHIQLDTEGKKGDVRDLIITVGTTDPKEIGVSAKNNNNAVKHPRISNNINIGQEWMGVACSDNYFKEVGEQFAPLVEKKGKNWSTEYSEDGKGEVYKGVCLAVIKEITNICQNNEEAVANLVKFLIGRKSFYKLINQDSKSFTLEAYDFNNSLTVGQLDLPSKIEGIRFKEGSNHTFIIDFDKNWSLSFRIHNASSKIEPSLKFDIRLEKSPFNLHRKTFTI